MVRSYDEKYISLKERKFKVQSISVLAMSGNPGFVDKRVKKGLSVAFPLTQLFCPFSLTERMTRRKGQISDPIEVEDNQDNGRFKNADNQAPVNSNYSRLSIATFQNLALDSIVYPLKINEGEKPVMEEPI
ncbi:hypothetical protein LguiB_013553 [Lonicera macranthoides]